ncbi:MAG: (2Fe-2S)-binding protein, partial [Actinobacteria bacterium]|nr:(2Fe-2S)-binding protein [Actinomycetota bacterium]NIV56405.1 (2Fe-2S)-binding protein [Actinomycetota bacterium]
MRITITINGIDTDVDIHGPDSLLDVLRDQLALP